MHSFWEERCGGVEFGLEKLADEGDLPPSLKLDASPCLSFPLFSTFYVLYRFP